MSHVLRPRVDYETDSIGDSMIQPGTGAWDFAATVQHSSMAPALGARRF
jgi:hypothetical protein